MLLNLPQETNDKLTLSKLLLICVFIMLPLFDAINGYLVVNGVLSEAGIASPSQLGRLLVSILLLYLVFEKKLGVVPILLLCYLLIIEVVSGLIHQTPYGFTYGIVSAYKIGYLIFLTIVLLHYAKTITGMMQLGQFVKFNLIIIASLLYFSTLTGIGNSTYGFGFGTKSFFASGNGLGLYLGVSTLFLLGLKRYELVSINNKILLFIIVSIALIGSKTALVLCLVNLIILMISSKYKVLFMALITILAVTILPTIVEVLSTVFDVILKRLGSSDNIIMYLASGRVDYVSEAFETFFKSDPNSLRLVFGMGAFTSFQSPELVTKFDTLETDLFDLLFMYGFISILFYLSVIFFTLYYLRNYKILFVGMLLLSLHSIIAGHVLFNGMSSVCFALFICVANYLNKNKRLYDKAFT